MAGLLFILIFLFQGVPGTEPVSVTERFVAEAYRNHTPVITVDDGLSQNLIFSIHKDRRGFLWFGTKDGLNRYDGYNFRVYRHSVFDSTTISSPYILSIAEDKEGYLWLASNKHWVFDRFDPVTGKAEQHTIIPPENAIPGSGLISKIVPTKNGWLYLLAPQKIIAYHPETKKTYFITHPNWTGLFDLIWDGSRLWITDRKTGLYSLSFLGSKPVYYPFKEHRDRTALALSGETLWVGSDFAIQAFNTAENKWGPLIKLKPQMKEWDEVKDIQIDTHGNLYVQFNTDVAKWLVNKQQWENYLVKDTATEIFLGEDGLLWVGTNGFGAIKLDTEPKPFYSSAGNITEIVYPEAFSELKNQCGYGGNPRIFDLLEDENYIWFGMGYKGLGRHNKKTGKAACIKLSAKGKPLAVLVLTKSQNGTIIVGAENYVFDMNAQNMTWPVSFMINTGQNSARMIGLTGSYPITAVYEAPDGIIWIGTSYFGLMKYDPAKDKLIKFEKRDKRYSKTSSPMILDISPDPIEPSRYLWIGTDGGGLNRLDLRDESFTYFTEQDGLPNQVIYSVLPDSAGYLWMSSNRGLIKFHSRTFEVNHFDIRNGLLNNEFNRREFYASPEGRFYFGGINGVNSFDPAQIIQSAYKPPVVISDVRLFRKSIYLRFKENRRNGNKKILEFPYYKNSFSFEFASLDYSIPGKTHYRYRLRGFDDEWVEAGYERTAAYTNLPPGDYYFEVMGSNSDGVWNPRTAELAFSITPPFWTALWFRILMIFTVTGAIAAIAWAIFRKNYRKKMLEIEKQALVDSERLRISKDMHDELGAQLTQIRFMSEMGQMQKTEEEQSDNLLSEISDSVGATMSTLSSMVWSVDPGNDTLDNLAGHISQYTVDYLAKMGKKCRLSIDRNLPAVPVPSKVRHNLVLCVKEAVNNAVKYSGEDLIRLGLSLKNSELEIYISDNGLGFDPQKVNDLSNGLKNIQRRMKAIGGHAVIKSELNRGTTIRLNCTINISSR